MKKGLLIIAIIMIIGFTAAMFSGCTNDATVVSRNLSKAADQFEVYRRVVFYNGITDTYILSIEGYCSVEFFANKFVVTVKTDDGTYLKHYLGRADNVFPFVEQLNDVPVSDRHYRVVFKPSVIIPDIEKR